MPHCWYMLLGTPNDESTKNKQREPRASEWRVRVYEISTFEFTNCFVTHNKKKLTYLVWYVNHHKNSNYLNTILNTKMCNFLIFYYYKTIITDTQKCRSKCRLFLLFIDSYDNNNLLFRNDD